MSHLADFCQGLPNIQQHPEWLQTPSVCPQPHVCTAFDILRDRPRGTINDFSCGWAVATKTMIHSGFQPVLYYISRKCSSEAGSVCRNCPETPDPIMWNTYYLHRKPWQIFFFQDETLVAQKKGCFSAFYSMLENLRENTRIGQLYVTELVSSFHQVAPFSLSLKSWNFLLSQCQDKKIIPSLKHAWSNIDLFV